MSDKAGEELSGENQQSQPDGLETRWPTAGDRAFKPVPFLYGAWTADDVRERLWRMVRGYRHTGDALVTETEATPHLRPTLIYPIIFSYRHSLELALKQLLEDHGQSIGKAPEFRKHQLDEIWPSCRAVIEHFNSGADPAPLDAIAKVIEEFSEVDPVSFSFRYASDTKGRRLDLKIRCIDLLELREVMAGIHNFLECVDMQIQATDYQ